MNYLIKQIRCKKKLGTSEEHSEGRLNTETLNSDSCFKTFLYAVYKRR